MKMLENMILKNVMHRMDQKRERTDCDAIKMHTCGQSLIENN